MELTDRNNPRRFTGQEAPTKGYCLIAAISMLVAVAASADELRHPVIVPVDGFVLRSAPHAKVSNFNEFRFRQRNAQGMAESSIKQGKSWDLNSHTPAPGGGEHNLELSGQRAATVTSYLLLYGISGNRLTTTGFSESKPVGDNATEEGRALNRRVELYRMGG